MCRKKSAITIDERAYCEIKAIYPRAKVGEIIRKALKVYKFLRQETSLGATVVLERRIPKNDGSDRIRVVFD